MFNKKYGPWAVITGATSGIGLEFAVQLATKNQNLVLISRDKFKLEKIKHNLAEQFPIEIICIEADLSKDDFIIKIENEISNLDIGLLVNNAGFATVGEFINSDIAQEINMLKVNCQAPLYLTHLIAKKLVERKTSGIIFVSSISGIAPMPYWSNYSATKSYLSTLAQGIGYELRNYNVDTLVLCPGTVQTQFHQKAGLKIARSHMTAKDVVNQALDNLGKKTVLIPGIKNRILSFLSRYLPQTFIIKKRAKTIQERII